VAKAILPYEDEKYMFSWIESSGQGFSPPTS